MSNNAINISSVSSAIISNENGVLSATSPMTSGQMLIGSTGAAPVATSLTAGPGVSILPGAGALTIGAAGGNLINIQYLTDVSGTYTPTAGTNKCIVLAVAGGGGGAGTANAPTSNMRVGGGGGGGAAAYKFYSTVPAGSSYAVGTGGAGGAGNGNGVSGNPTTFNNADMHVLGGSGGLATGNLTGFSTPGGLVDPADNSDYASAGGASYYITFPGITFTALAGSVGGASGLGVGQGAFTIVGGSGNATPGSTPTGYGGGGSGGISRNAGGAAPGGAGSRGVCIVWEYS